VTTARTGGVGSQSGAPQVAIEIGAGVATVGLGLLAAYLRARVDQRIAQRQIDAFLQVARGRINANPDEALRTMMRNPEATVYAWVYLDSATISTVDVQQSSISPEPVMNASSPIFDLSRIEYWPAPADQSLADPLRISGGGLHMTTVHSMIVDIPLRTPPLEDLIAAARARNLPLDDLRTYAQTRLQAALTTSELAAGAYAATANALQTGTEAYNTIRAGYELARRRRDVELQGSMARRMLEVAQLNEATAARLAPTREAAQRAQATVEHWQHILSLIDPARP
jgi:hypothetical protein